MNRGGSRGTVTFSFPSRFFPAVGLGTFFVTIISCILLNRYYNHDIGGIYWPYLSDTGKLPPESALFGFGLTLTSVWIATIVTLNFGRVKREIEINGSLAEGLNKSGDPSSAGWKGWKRNQVSLILGLAATPFLGLLAVFDTARSPELHLAFVLGFFPLMVAYTFVNTSVYKILLEHKRRRDRIQTPSFKTLRSSVRAKILCCNALLFFVILYLPIGMYLVTDWYNYANDIYVHTFRAINQHLSVFCLVFYFGSFWYDFGTLRMTVLQTEDVKDD
eukprot:TRINITY_DN686_c2_g1_i1.p1 TRINITY_DN686_c2_g1~~TRINITY_DN686_c2_g1_i1.p1  ORF type:complete len:275 (-),score=126.63 TRINITY_DN686_c2_g1_i1:140-964(-)